jgi:hypothetical protein
MIKKLRNQPYAPKWEQEEEKKKLSSVDWKYHVCCGLKQVGTYDFVN